MLSGFLRSMGIYSRRIIASEINAIPGRKDGVCSASAIAAECPRCCRRDAARKISESGIRRTRYDKLAADYLAFIKRILLRAYAYESRSQSGWGASCAGVLIRCDQ